MSAQLAISDPHGSRPSDLTDEQLLQQYTAGQQDAADELFRRYEQPAFRLTFHLLGNHADAQDAVQDACLNAWRFRNQFRGTASFKTWWMEIVKNAALHLKRKRKRSPNSLSAEQCADYAGHNSETSELSRIANRELCDVIRRILKQHATPRMRKVYMLWLEGLACEQIAKYFGLSERMVRLEKHNVMCILRTKLSELGWSPS